MTRSMFNIIPLIPSAFLNINMLVKPSFDTVRNGRQYKVQTPQRPVGTLSTATTAYDDTT
ncbi:hypothetical protein FWK35_00006764 [Aphis craccivora]|uniref:Uncharacterized protein n=1 Tax=Aphis craccivora TaxID=307492 RepID=A0A6G0ZF66_APHCR|nr:hypothetical protein FWK35_00006764 [Aphis craccivora]